MRISDTFLGYIVSHIDNSGNSTHVFLHVLKRIDDCLDTENSDFFDLKAIPNSNGDVNRECRFYYLQGQRRIFPSLVHLVNYYRVRFWLRFE